MKTIKIIKKYLILYLSIAAILFGFTRCEEVLMSDKDFLGQTPETVGFPLDSMFSSRENAERVLTKAYSYGPYPFEVIGDVNSGGFTRTIYEAITDMGVNYFFNDGALALIYPGILDASNVHDQHSYYKFNADRNHYAIRYAYFFLENVDKVPDYPEDIKKARKGEAHLIIAMSFFNQLREVGGTPWIPNLLTLENMPEKFERMTVEQQVNRIDSLLLLAASELPWYHPDDGDYTRHSKASALGLRVRVLLEAARPLFNSDTPYHPDAAGNRYTWYGNYSADRWKRAEDAGKEFMDALNANGYYDLIQPKGTTHDDYRQAFFDGHATRMKGEGNTEALITAIPVNLRNGNVQPIYQNNNPRHWGGARSFGKMGTLEHHNWYPFVDGTDFPADFDWDNPPFNPWYDASGNPSRDPRLYETYRITGDYKGNRWMEVWNDGNGFKQGRDASPHHNDRGNFWPRKFIGEYDNIDYLNKPIQHSYLRLPEVFLAYAEAINEANGGPDATAYAMINRVRNRVGLPDLTPGLSQVEFRKALIRERALEFFYEDVIWFDIKFWKMTDRLTTPCHSLLIYKTSGVGSTIESARKNVWKFAVSSNLPNRHWWREGNWDNKWLIWPFPQDDIDKNYGLVQNPGW